MARDAIILEDIHFSYGEKMVLEHLTLHIEEGMHVGIIGESGGGKSTLLKLISGLYEPDAGKIVVAGESNSEQIMKKVSVVMQHTALFPTTIRENITCGHDYTEKVILEACETASLMDWIRTLPEGMDTFVGERGGKVSGGQAQRIAIARAICKNAPIVLLDEATSALDKGTEEAVLTAIKRLTIGKTVLHVTHHPERLSEDYMLYRLEEGRLLHAGIS